MVLNVLREFLHYKLSKKYKLLLSIKSAECPIVATVMEDGHGLRNAWQFVNEFR